MLLAATRHAREVTLSPGVLQWIGTGVWAAAGWLTIRGILARSRVQLGLTDQRAQALTLLQTNHLQIVLAEVVTFVVHEMNQMIGRSHKERADRIPVFLARADLGAQRKRLVEIGDDAMAFDRLQDDMVTCAHRCGWAAGLFLIPWGYLLFWGSEKGIQLPVWLTAAAWGLAAAAIGYGVAQAWQERTAATAFASLQRRYEAGVT